jgi:hypothetical protein
MKPHLHSHRRPLLNHHPHPNNDDDVYLDKLLSKNHKLTSIQTGQKKYKKLRIIIKINNQ